MFQNCILNAIETPNPVNIKGMAFTRVSEKFRQEPKAPRAIAAYVANGSAPETARRIPPKINETKKERTGTRTSAPREID
jgi:hypothetical protein